MLSVSLLGNFRLAFADQPLPTPRSGTAVALLGYIVAECRVVPAGAAVHALESRFHRRQLAELFWPGLPARYARKNLRQTIYTIRKWMPPESGPRSNRLELFLSPDRHTLCLNPSLPVELDAARYLALTRPDADAAELRAAAALYRGEFLDGVYIDGTPEFEQWLNASRLEWQQRQLELLGRLAHAALELGDMEQASAYARKQLHLEPASEQGHRLLMLAAALGGHRRAAIAHYHRFADMLMDQLLITPSLETRQLHQAIAGSALDQWLRDQGLPLPRQAAPPIPAVRLAAARQVPTNLPYLPRPLIDRDSTLRQLCTMVGGSECRLATITGPGGIGKTLLALTASFQLLEEARRGGNAFQDGIFLVELSQLSDLSSACFAVARALDLKLDTSTEAFTAVELQLRSFLRRRQLLLILDGLDDLMADAAPLVEMLLASPGVQLIATTQERLSIRAERIIPLTGLSYPDLAEAKDAGWVARSDAARLFIDAARQLDPQFSLENPEELLALAQICRMTQGNPLALELAAEQAPYIDIGAIAAQMEHSLDILHSSHVDQPERHRSMRAIFEQSWKHLDQRQRRVIAVFSLFQQGCTLEAAERITGASFADLIALVGKSLLILDSHNRYGLPGVLRQYCAEQLARLPDLSHASADAHSDYYCQLLLDWANLTDAASKWAAHDALAAESGNILAAWRWALDHGRLVRLTQIILSMEHYFAIAGLFAESRAFFDDTITSLQRMYGDFPRDPDAVRLICLAIGSPGIEQGRVDTFHHGAGTEELEDRLRYGLALLRSVVMKGRDLRLEEALLRRRLAQILRQQPERRIQTQLSRSLYHEIGHTKGSFEMDLMVIQQDVAADIASQNLLESVTRAVVQAQAIDDAKLICRALRVKALVMRHRLRSHHRALSLLGEAYQVAVSHHLFADAIAAGRDAAWLNWFNGAFDQALQLQRQSIALARENQMRISQAALLAESGYTYLHMGQFARAADMAEQCIALDKRAAGFSGVRRLQALSALHLGDYGRAQGYAGQVKGPDCWTLRVQAWIAIADGDYLAAAELAALSRRVSPVSDHSPGGSQRWAWSGTALAAALQGLGQLPEAARTLEECVQIIAPARAFSPAAHLLPIAALQLAYHGRFARAEELFSLALTVPFSANSLFFQEHIGTRLAQLTRQLTPQERAACRSRGMEQDWWTAIDSLPQELSRPA